jgi:tight adherence protein B
VMLSLVVTLLSGAFGGLLAGAVTICTPFAWIAGRRRRRLAAFERQLPDTLALLAGSLRAGFSFMQGLEAVAQEIGPPMRRELQRVFTEARLGRPPEDALADAAARMGSKDLMWTVMAIKIQREVGGNLATLLDTVADTMQKRERIRREVRALTAEGRFSAVILSLAPPAVGVGLYLLQPSYIKTLFDHAVGLGALVGAVVLAIAGFFWLRRIIDIEV